MRRAVLKLFEAIVSVEFMVRQRSSIRWQGHSERTENKRWRCHVER